MALPAIAAVLGKQVIGSVVANKVGELAQGNGEGNSIFDSLGGMAEQLNPLKDKNPVSIFG